MITKSKIFYITCASLAFLIAVTPDATAMDKRDKERAGISQLRDHTYYKAELRKLEQSTVRIHKEVDRILKAFRENMGEYYNCTRGGEGRAAKTMRSTTMERHGEASKREMQRKVEENRRKKQEAAQCKEAEQREIEEKVAQMMREGREKRRKEQEAVQRKEAELKERQEEARRQFAKEAELQRREREQERERQRKAVEDQVRKQQQEERKRKEEVEKEQVRKQQKELEMQAQQQERAQQPVAGVTKSMDLTINWITGQPYMNMMIQVPFTPQDIIIYAETNNQGYAMGFLKSEDGKNLIGEIIKKLNSGLVPQDDFISLYTAYTRIPPNLDSNKGVIAKYADGLYKKSQEEARRRNEQEEKRKAGEQTRSNEAAKQKIEQEVAQRKQQRETEALRRAVKNPWLDPSSIKQQAVYNYYYGKALKLLQVDEDSKDDKLTGAYRKLCTKLHPDKDPTQEAAFKELTSALEYIRLYRKTDGDMGDLYRGW